MGFVWRYPRRVELERLRGRLPLVAFILLVVVCAALIGFVCACLSDQLGPGLERPFMPALIVLWLSLVALAIPIMAPAARFSRATGRASPSDLQRFLF